MSLFNRNLVNRIVPWSETHLRQFTNHGAKQDFFRRSAFHNVVWFFDDFLGDTIDLNNYALAKAGGTADANFAISVAENGKIRGSTGTDDNNGINLITPLIYYGDRNCGMQIRFKVNAATSLNMEAGFIDAVPGSTGPGVADVDVPTITAGDCALLHMDTDQTLATLAFVTAGSTSGQPDQATTLAAPLPTLPTADTYMTLTIQIVGNNVEFMVNGMKQAHAYDADGHIEGGTALAAWFYCRSRAASAARTPDIDYLAIWADRN